jgi:hypothetical protein
MLMIESPHNPRSPAPEPSRPRKSHSLKAVALIALLVMMSGCVRERTTDDLTTYHYKWWVWVGAIAVPLAFLGMALARHPTTWVNGVWRPWWKFRGWNYKDALTALTAVMLLVVAPFQLGNRVEVGPQHFQEGNAFGLRTTRRIAWSDLRRIDVKSAQAPGKWTPDRDKAHDKKPDMVAVFKDNQTQEFRGALPMAAREEIQRRARAAGVMVVTTDNPGMVPGLAPQPMQGIAVPQGGRAFPPMQPPNRAQEGFR